MPSAHFLGKCGGDAFQIQEGGPAGHKSGGGDDDDDDGKGDDEDSEGFEER